MCRSRFCLFAKLLRHFTIVQQTLEYSLAKETIQSRPVPDRGRILLFVNISKVSIHMVLIGVCFAALRTFERKLEKQNKTLPSSVLLYHMSDRILQQSRSVSLSLRGSSLPFFRDGKQCDIAICSVWRMSSNILNIGETWSP